MQKYVQKMVQEFEDLNGKIKKADAALNGNPFGMDNKSRELLSAQLEIMRKYAEILKERIDYEND